MDVLPIQTDLAQTKCDALVLGVSDNWRNSLLIQKFDAATGGWFAQALSSGEIPTKALKTTSLIAVSGILAKTVIVVGLGEPAKYDAGVAFRAAAAGVMGAAVKKRSVIVVAGMHGVGFPGSELQGIENQDKEGQARRKHDDELLQRSAVAGGIVGGVGQDLFRKEKNLFPPDTILWHALDANACSMGETIGNSINLTRRLVNLPAAHLYPETFADEAALVAQKNGLEIEVWDQQRLEQERCGALLAVGCGSSRESRLVKLTYAGKNTQAHPIVLVGKGVTFDSGGLSIKTTEGMLTMKADMAGAATVLGVMQAIARLKPETPVVGLMGLAENMISGSSFKLGDVLTARSGKTIEIHNTDAEGRLVLADVLDVACELSPKCIVDFATLTGACVVALGNDVAGLMTNDEVWQAQIMDAAKRCGEYVWPLPMFSFYSEQIAGKVADIKNVGEGRWGGAITAAKFLEEFVGDVPWTHVDLAGPAFLDSAKPWCDAGGSGFMVRTMIELLMTIESPIS